MPEACVGVEGDCGSVRGEYRGDEHRYPEPFCLALARPDEGPSDPLAAVTIEHHGVDFRSPVRDGDLMIGVVGCDDYLDHADHIAGLLGYVNEGRVPAAVTEPLGEVLAHGLRIRQAVASGIEFNVALAAG